MFCMHWYVEQQQLLHMDWTRRKARRISWCLILVAEHLMSHCWQLTMVSLRCCRLMETLISVCSFVWLCHILQYFCINCYHGCIPEFNLTAFCKNNIYFKNPGVLLFLCVQFKNLLQYAYNSCRFIVMLNNLYRNLILWQNSILTREQVISCLFFFSTEYWGSWPAK